MNHKNRLIVVVLLIFVAANVSNLKPAQAQIPLPQIWNFDDGFEGSNPQSRWSCWNTDGWGTCFYNINDTLMPRTGLNNATIWVKDGWTSIGRNVSITPFQTRIIVSCTARFYIYNTTSLSAYPYAAGQLEVIDVATWNYIAIKTFKITNMGYYSSLVTASWNPPNKDVHVRVGVNGQLARYGHVQVDDMRVSCIYL